MNGEPIDSDGGEAVVTYTRMPGRWRSQAPGSVRAERSSQTYRGGGLDRVKPQEADGYRVGCSGPRVEPNVDDFVEDSGRSGRARYGLIGASLALISGVGILAATVGTATLLPGDGARVGNSSGPVLASTGNEFASGLATRSDSIRKIPLASGAAESAKRVEVAPPIPRPRPEKPFNASAEAEPAPPPVLPPPTQSASSDTSALITNIEATLARIDEADAVEAGAAVPAPVVPQANASTQATTPVAPPVVITEPIYTPPAGISPALAGPSYEALPPSPAAEGYETYSVSPVPPELVPQVYPQAWPADPDTQVYPQNPGVYPAAPYLLSPERDADSEARRPGFLRRTIVKATGAVGRVFAGN